MWQVHIEGVAVDLAWDAIARFGAGQPRAFSNDFVTVAEDEARHFSLLEVADCLVSAPLAHMHKSLVRMYPHLHLRSPLQSLHGDRDGRTWRHCDLM